MILDRLILLSLWLLVFNFNYDNVQPQVIADSKSQNINFYKEMLYPAFRRHRARIRPFAKLLGAPINHIRGTRDTENKRNKTKYLKVLTNFIF